MSCVSSIALSAAVKFDYLTILRLPAFVAGFLVYLSTVFFFLPLSPLSSLSLYFSLSLSFSLIFNFSLLFLF